MFPVFFFTCVSFHFPFFLFFFCLRFFSIFFQTSSLRSGWSKATRVTVGRHTDQSFGVCDVNLATLKVAMKKECTLYEVCFCKIRLARLKNWPFPSGPLPIYGWNNTRLGHVEEPSWRPDRPSTSSCIYVSRASPPPSCSPATPNASAASLSSTLGSVHNSLSAPACSLSNPLALFCVILKRKNDRRASLRHHRHDSDGK